VGQVTLDLTSALACQHPTQAKRKETVLMRTIGTVFPVNEGKHLSIGAAVWHRGPLAVALILIESSVDTLFYSRFFNALQSNLELIHCFRGTETSKSTYERIGDDYHFR